MGFVSWFGVSVDGVDGLCLGLQFGMLLRPIHRLILTVKVVSPTFFGSLATKLEDIVSIVVAKTQEETYSFVSILVHRRNPSNSQPF